MFAKNRKSGSDHKSDALIQLKNVIKRYPVADGYYEALKGIDMTVRPSEFVAVIGRSGSGKSTLLNMITGIDSPSEGEVIVGGHAVHAMAERKMAGWRGRQMGIIFQFFQLLPTLTVAENVILPMEFTGLYSVKERRERARYLLDLVEVGEHADKMPSKLSGGQQQRVAIARALATDPPLIVADEPTGNLDSRTADAVFGLFDQLVTDEGKTILMVTHDGALAQRVHRAIIVQDGRIVNDDPTERLSFQRVQDYMQQEMTQ
jgi:putative ABC transport system ATP-binding protein